MINPAIAVSAFKLSATTIVGGAGVTATVTLGEPAPGNGAYVSIESSDTAAVPSLFAFIAPGQTTVTVPVPTNSVSAVATVTLTADFSDSTATATLTVDPVGTASVSINLSEVVTVSDAESFSDLVDDESITVSDKVTLSEDVPDVVGDVSSTAITDLTTVGLTIGTITYVYNDSVPAGEVISQSPGPTTTDSSGVTVSLVISRGPPPTATIPETVGVNDTVTISAITPGIQIALAGAPTLARSASGISVTVPLRNTGNVGARTVVETGGTLNGVTQLGSPAPVALAAGATRSVTVRFPLTGTAGEIVHLAVAGTYAGATVNGKWGVGARVVLP